MADIFISYKAERRGAIAHITRILENHGFTVWYDYALLSGSQFVRLIEREIRDAKAVLVLWCSRSVRSDWVLEEASLAKDLGKNHVGFVGKLLDGCVERVPADHDVE